MTIIMPSDEPDDRLLANRSTVVRQNDAQLTMSGMRCGGCGREVVQLDWLASRALKRAEPGKRRSLRAFECAWCQVVIFEDEMIDGQFVPHFVNLSTKATVRCISEQLPDKKVSREDAGQR